MLDTVERYRGKLEEKTFRQKVSDVVDFVSGSLSKIMNSVRYKDQVQDDVIFDDNDTLPIESNFDKNKRFYNFDDGELSMGKDIDLAKIFDLGYKDILSDIVIEKEGVGNVIIPKDTNNKIRYFINENSTVKRKNDVINISFKISGIQYNNVNIHIKNIGVPVVQERYLEVNTLEKNNLSSLKNKITFDNKGMGYGEKGIWFNLPGNLGLRFDDNNFYYRKKALGSFGEIDIDSSNNLYYLPYDNKVKFDSGISIEIADKITGETKLIPILIKNINNKKVQNSLKPSHLTEINGKTIIDLRKNLGLNNYEFPSIKLEGNNANYKLYGDQLSIIPEKGYKGKNTIFVEITNTKENKTRLLKLDYYIDTKSSFVEKIRVIK